MRILKSCLLFVGLALCVADAAARPADAPKASASTATSTATAARPTPSAPQPAEIAAETLTAVPRGKGLPVVVRTAVCFVNLDSVDENEGAFVATIDIRIRWVDLRLRYAPAEAPEGFKEFRAAAADARLAEIWAPDVMLTNMIGEPEYNVRGLRIFPDGRVELMQRTTARFATTFDVEKFPFDRQKLRVEMVSRLESVERVAFDFRQDDLSFCKAATGVGVDGWTTGLVDLRREPEAGWYGDSHARLVASLEVTRKPGSSLAPIFIPLFASLLIPLLAIWLNWVQDAEFQIEAFELANVIIGGLFAVIALNFTVYSEYPMLASADNLVARLFGLNYITLAVSLITNIILFHFQTLKRHFGKYVQEQTYLYLVWAVPLLALVSATALLLVAMV